MKSFASAVQVFASAKAYFQDSLPRPSTTRFCTFALPRASGKQTFHKPSASFRGLNPVQILKNKFHRKGSCMRGNLERNSTSPQHSFQHFFIALFSNASLQHSSQTLIYNTSQQHPSPTSLSNPTLLYKTLSNASLLATVLQNAIIAATKTHIQKSNMKCTN